ncbi:hypothetical protein [Bifidobacterium sp. ESL0704]|uniref:hypothetical protein n=1 Tax=Bifidobacterium sp. ESL0704 TaxID=2983219 RepID=UPI0023F8566D|nr:hypothetical protein [Bifidobacterium sp. ESL0704]WEV53597.1 hypothetical protein OZX64_03810 [Bifidobacterium sp. ESL0704]
MKDTTDSSDDKLGVSGVIGLGFFFVVFVVATAVPFVAGGYLIRRFFVFGQVRDWAQGWRFLLGMVVAFLLWFFLTYLTDKLVYTFCPRARHKVLNEVFSTIADFGVGWVLMAVMFIDARGSFMATLLSVGLSWVIGLILDRVLPDGFEEEKKPETMQEKQPG